MRWFKGVIAMLVVMTSLVFVEAQEENAFAIITPENASQLEVIQTIDLGETYANQIAFNPNNTSQLAVAQRDEILSVWNVETGSQIQSWQEESIVNDVAYSKDGEHLLSATTECVHVRELVTGVVSNSICVEGYINPVDAFRLIPLLNDRVWVAYEDGKVLLWNTETGNLIIPIYGPSGRPIHFIVSQDGQWMALRTRQGFYLYHLDSLQAHHIYLEEFLKSSFIVAAAFFPRIGDFRRDMAIHESGLVTVKYESQPSLWGIDKFGNYSAEQSLPLETNFLVIEKSVFNTDGQLMAVAGYDDYVDPIDVYAEDAVISCRVNDVNVCHVSVFSIEIHEPDIEHDGEFYELPPQEMLSTNIAKLDVTFHKTYSLGDTSNDAIFSDLVFSPDDRFLATSTYDGLILIWGIPQP